MAADHFEKESDRLVSHLDLAQAVTDLPDLVDELVPEGVPGLREKTGPSLFVEFATLPALGPDSVNVIEQSCGQGPFPFAPIKPYSGARSAALEVEPLLEVTLSAAENAVCKGTETGAKIVLAVVWWRLDLLSYGVDNAKIHAPDPEAVAALKGEAPRGPQIDRVEIICVALRAVHLILEKRGVERIGLRSIVEIGNVGFTLAQMTTSSSVGASSLRMELLTNGPIVSP